MMANGQHSYGKHANGSTRLRARPICTRYKRRASALEQKIRHTVGGNKKEIYCVLFLTYLIRIRFGGYPTLEIKIEFYREERWLNRK